MIAFRRIAEVAIALLLAACAAREPLPITPPADVKSAPVARVPVEPATPAVPAAPAPAVVAAAPPTRLEAAAIPAGAIYVCASGAGAQRQVTAIQFDPKVGGLCRKHPEMGPCQYERNLCRGSGGRVYAPDGTEITLATEAEYDKKVMRVRFKSN
jgi:NaMN:DMB phosphoribosyltransferase